MRLLRLVLLTVLVSSGLLVAGGAGPASACSCAYQHPADFVDGADEIFAGTLVSMADPTAREVMRSTDPVAYTVAVDAVYRGRVESAAVFESAMSGASCGLEGMVVDRRYVFFVSTDGSHRTASSCGGTAPATTGLVNAVERLVGAPVPSVVVDEVGATSEALGPVTSDGRPAQASISGWIIGIVGTIGGAALVSAGFRLRRRAT